VDGFNLTVALTGASGGAMKKVADCTIRMPTDETPRIQECHILTGHMICEIAEEMLCESPEAKAPAPDFAAVTRHQARGAK